MGAAINPPPQTDGRIARSQRTRVAVVDALLELLNEGDLQPTAQRIAQRANVSLRLVFHHFEDLETIYTEVQRRQIERTAPMFLPAISPTAPLNKRVTELVAQRTRILEFISPVRRHAVLRAPFAPTIANLLAGAREMARDQIAEVFERELIAMPAAERRDVLNALAVAMSWESWEFMRRQQGQSEADARRVMERTIRALLAKRS
ncbi:MAG TPA: TetR/AcrR family transcriptional regulator [Candidatus Binataceae bacterium]|nr:TetR/AcrR family transcriptional regulator [Candidatus Binataceae bacterium]